MRLEKSNSAETLFLLIFERLMHHLKRGKMADFGYIRRVIMIMQRVISNMDHYKCYSTEDMVNWTIMG